VWRLARFLTLQRRQSMTRRRRRVTAAVAACALVAVLAPTAPASADVAGPYFATQGLGSDPHIIECTNPGIGGSNPVDGYCLYTSRDMGQSYAYPGNYYPMRYTRVYFSENGYSDWQFMSTAFNESTLWASNGGWVPDNAYHLWAPAAIQYGDYYYLYVPDVSDISNDAPPNISTTSRIAVARSTSPFGPFDYQGTVPYSSGYMSDPDVFVEGSNRYLIWANGDNSTCGGFSSARLNSNMRTLVAGSTQDLDINGIGVLGNCGGTGRPYLEGASLYKFDDAKMPGPYTLVFAAKPTTNVPTDCQAQWTGSGSADTTYEVIAYATADDPDGPYTYRGIIMCGSTTEWTNQATIMRVTTPAGHRPWVIVYHDSPAEIKERKLHAECLYAGAGRIAGVYRQPLDAANGFNDCMNDVNPTYRAYHVTRPGAALQPPPILSVNPNLATENVRLNRYAVGPWERFREYSLGGGVYAYKSLANGKYICNPVNSSHPLNAECTSAAEPSARFTKSIVSGTFRLKSEAYGLWVDWFCPQSPCRLITSLSSSANALVFAPMTRG
jgi:hypothetical protein